MDTYMDTSGFIGFPFDFLEFFFCNDIIAPKFWSGSVAGDGHDGEVVVAGEALYAGLKALGRKDWPTGGEH